LTCVRGRRVSPLQTLSCALEAQRPAYRVKRALRRRRDGAGRAVALRSAGGALAARIGASERQQRPSFALGTRRTRIVPPRGAQAARGRSARVARTWGRQAAATARRAWRQRRAGRRARALRWAARSPPERRRTARRGPPPAAARPRARSSRCRTPRGPGRPSQRLVPTAVASSGLVPTAVGRRATAGAARFAARRAWRDAQHAAQHARSAQPLQGSGRALRLCPRAGRTIFVRSLLFDPLPSLPGGAPSAAAMRRRALRALAALSHAPPCAAPPQPRLPPPLAAAPPRRAFSSDASDEPQDEPLLSAMDRLRMSLDLQGIKRNAVPAHVGVQRAPMLIPFCHVGGALLGMRGTGCWQRGHQHTTGSLFGARRPPFGPLHAAWRRRRPDRARRGVRWCQLLGFGIAGLRGAGPRCFSADRCFGCGSPALAASPGAGLRRSRPRPPTPPCGRRPPSWGCRRRCGLLARERQSLAGTPNPPLL
jgi:hypothetical protein